MIDFGTMKNSRAMLAVAAVMLAALGAAGGAGAVQATRPTVEMAPTIRTPIAKLPQTSGIVTVKGPVAEVYGDRLVVQDASGRAMIAVGRDADGTVKVGQIVSVQGRYADGQLRASYLVDASGKVAAVGPHGPAERGPHGGPGHDGPPPPPGCAPAPVGAIDAAAPPPPPPAGVDRDAR